MVSITLASITKALRSPRFSFESEAKLKSTANKRFKEVEKLKKMPKAKWAYLTLTYPRNSTYGNRSAKAVLEGEYADGKPFRFTASSSGVGYDRATDAAARVLNKAARQNLLSRRTLPRYIDSGIPGLDIPKYSERWDVSVFEHIGTDLGLKVEKIRRNNSEDIFKVIWK